MNWITQWISLIFKKLFSYLKHIANNHWPLTISGLDQIGSTPGTLSLTFCHLMKYRVWSHPVWSGFAKASNKWPSYCLFSWLYTVQNWENKKNYILSCVIINLVFLYLVLFSLKATMTFLVFLTTAHPTHSLWNIFWVVSPVFICWISLHNWWDCYSGLVIYSYLKEQCIDSI